MARDYFYAADGRPKPLWAEFQRAVSLYDFAATNLNSVGPTVLSASGWDTTQSTALQKYLTTPVSATKSRPYLRSLQEARRQVGNAATRNFGAQIQLLRIHVTARQGAAQLKLSALVTWAGQAKLPAPLAASTPAGASPAPPAPAANTLRYPFTLLEFSENTLPDPPPPPDAPAA